MFEKNHHNLEFDVFFVFDFCLLLLIRGIQGNMNKMCKVYILRFRSSLDVFLYLKKLFQNLIHFFMINYA